MSGLIIEDSSGQTFSNSTININANSVIEQFLTLKNLKCGITDWTFGY